MESGYKRNTVTLGQAVPGRLEELPVGVIDQNNDARAHGAALHEHFLLLTQMPSAKLLYKLSHGLHRGGQVKGELFLSVKHGLETATNDYFHLLSYLNSTCTFIFDLLTGRPRLNYIFLNYLMSPSSYAEHSSRLLQTAAASVTSTIVTPAGNVTTTVTSAPSIPGYTPMNDPSNSVISALGAVVALVVITLIAVVGYFIV